MDDLGIGISYADNSTGKCILQNTQGIWKTTIDLL